MVALQEFITRVLDGVAEKRPDGTGTTWAMPLASGVPASLTDARDRDA
jgi:hypothetical protein